MYLELLHYISFIINIFSVIIIFYGVIITIFKVVKDEISSKNAEDKMNNKQLIRAYLGSYILLSLELLIAADIIETIAHPSTNEILLLFATVIIRTLISFFLTKEIEELKK